MKKILKSKGFKIAITVTALLLVGYIVFSVAGCGKDKKVTTETATATVTRRNITNSVTGSGTVEAYETYNIVPTVTGEIVFCDVEEGQWVEEGQVLYQFDSETSDNAISKAENSVENASLSLESARENVENLTIKAPARGVVSGIDLSIGDKANGVVCTITDNTYMIAEIPVSASGAQNISVGDKVSVGIEKYMTTLTGYVERKSSGVQAGANGAMVTLVEVVVENTGSVLEGTYCSAIFHTKAGEVDGAEAAELNYSKPAKANAEQSGTVSKLNVKNGDWVEEGDVIAVLTNTSVTNQLKSAQMNYNDAVSNLADARKTAEESTLTAPIAGKVMQKKYKKGDTVAGNNSTTLMVLADTTKMKFTINIDELDVAKISIGQEVTIKADALEGEVFIGKVETVSLLGTSSSGVTYYPVNVVIDRPGDLIPGMNVSAEIIVESAENVVAVPSGAVYYFDGAYYVNVVGEIEGMTDMTPVVPFEKATGEKGGGMPFERATGEREAGGRLNKNEQSPTEVQREEGAMPSKSGRTADKTTTQTKETMYSEAVRVQVVTGISDDSYTEIVSGDVAVGMIVEVIGSDTTTSFGMMGGRSGGMMGGMPMGGRR